MFIENKSYTIHKSNSIIRSNLNHYNLQQLKFFNSIYYLIQKNKSYIIKNKNIISVKYTKLIDLMGYTNQKTHPLSKIIKDSQKVLLEPIVVKNYISKKGKKKEYKQLQLIKYISIDNSKYKNIVNIKITKNFLNIVRQKNNWTKLDITFLNKRFASLFQYRLYEYLKSYNNLEKRKLFLKLDKYIEIFEAKNIYLSTIKLKIDRNIKILNSITDLDIEVNYSKYNNLIMFDFKNKTDIEINSLKETKKEKTDIEIEAKRIFDKLNKK